MKKMRVVCIPTDRCGHQGQEDGEENGHVLHLPLLSEGCKSLVFMYVYMYVCRNTWN